MRVIWIAIILGASMSGCGYSAYNEVQKPELAVPVSTIASVPSHPKLPKQALSSGAWEVAETVFSKPGSPSLKMIDRYRADLSAPLPYLPYEAVFQAEIKRPTKNGLFDESEEPQLKEFEDVLVREIEASGEGSLFCVHTLDGTRELVFYTHTDIASSAQSLLDKCPPGYKYSFGSKEDPHWQDFFSTKERLKAAAGKSVQTQSSKNKAGKEH